MTAQTFVDSDFATFYITDWTGGEDGVREITVPACSSSSGDTLIMVLYKQRRLSQADHLDPGIYYGLTEPGDGWNYVSAAHVGNDFAGDEVRVWSKESDGAQGNVTLQWPSPTYRSSQVAFGAMLAYSAADGYVNTNDPDPGYEFVGASQQVYKRDPSSDQDMSFEAVGVPCTLDLTLSSFFQAKHAGAPQTSMVGAIDIDAAINERIRWQVPVPGGGDVIPEAREIVVGDELDQDSVMPARTNSQTVAHDAVVWYAQRLGVYGIPDPGCGSLENAAYWGVLVDLV